MELSDIVAETIISEKKKKKARGKIGKVVRGVRKTKGGYVWKGWWYFQRELPDESGKGIKGTYWYMKRRNPITGDIEEEYVGKKLPFEIPAELK